MAGPLIWVVPQLRQGRLDPMSREALGAGRQLADLVGGSVEAILLGSGLEAAVEEVRGLDITTVRSLDHESVAVYTPGSHIGALRQAITALEPAYVLFPHTYQTVDFMPRLAQSCDAALVPEVLAMEGDAETGPIFRRPILGGKLHARVRAKGSGVVLLSVQSGAFGAGAAGSGKAAVSNLEVDTQAIRSDREILGTEEAAGEKVDLSQAEIIVSVGRGIGGEENMPMVEELAKALGAEVGASRPVIDSGWLPRDRQIGSSGQTVSPKLYIAVGISGAIQHLVGMKGSQIVVAINKDRNAPIFGVARYAIIGDLLEVVPALTRAVLEAE